MSTLAVRNNNPGNLRDPKTGSFRQFNTPQEGYEALKNDLHIKMSGQSRTGVTPQSSIEHFASVYAPASDNNDPVGYARNLSSQLGVPSTTPIANLSGRIDDFAKAIAKNEDANMYAMLMSGNFAGSGGGGGSRLSREQLEANINAMEQQGASQEEVQSYLDSLKNTQAPSNQINPMQGVQTLESRPTPPPVAPQSQATTTPPEEEVDFGTRLGRGVLDFIAPVLTKKERTPLQWAGDIGLTALNVVPAAGIAKLGIGGIKAGVNAIRGVKAASKAEKAAEAASAVVKSRLSPKNIGIGTGTGYGLDVSTSLSEGETDAGEVFKPGVGTILGAGGGALARTAPKAQVEKAARDLVPDLSYGKGVSSTGKTGQVKSGVLGNISQPITPEVYKTTEAVMRNVPNFNKLPTFTEKLNAVNEANARLADDLAQQVIRNGDDIIYPYKELASKMKAVELPIQIRADSTQLRQYRIAQEAALKIAKDKGGKISGLFEARKEFDRLVEKEFPTLYDRENAPMRQAITDIRRIMNEQIEQSLKARGVNYSDSLQQQTQLFRARDALASKAYGELGTNSAERFMQRHPYMTGALKQVLPVGAGAGVASWLLKD